MGLADSKLLQDVLLEAIQSFGLTGFLRVIGRRLQHLRFKRTTSHGASRRRERQTISSLATRSGLCGGEHRGLGCHSLNKRAQFGRARPTTKGPRCAAARSHGISAKSTSHGERSHRRVNDEGRTPSTSTKRSFWSWRQPASPCPTGLNSRKVSAR